MDNSFSHDVPSSSLFDIIEADDYYFPPVTGTYLRLSRMTISVLALMLTPTFLFMQESCTYIPDRLAFIRVSDPLNVPLIWQLLILEFAIDGLRLTAGSGEYPQHADHPAECDCGYRAWGICGEIRMV